jgi:hypothetical protein
MMETTRRPMWLAVVITPWLTPMAFFPLYAGYFIVMGHNRAGLSWAGFLVFSYMFGVPLGYVAIGLLGWPWVVKLRHWHKLAVGYVCGGSCVIGMGFFMAFTALLVGGNHQYSFEEILEDLLMGLVMGLLSGLIFCAIAGVPLQSRR